jgi:hypothetical protein
MNASLSAQNYLEKALISLDEADLLTALEAGADPNAPDVQGCPPLVRAIIQAPTAEERLIFDGGVRLAALKSDRLVDLLFAAGAAGSAVWGEGETMAAGVMIQIRKGVEDMGCFDMNPYFAVPANVSQSVAHIRRWYDHGANPCAVIGHDPDGAPQTVLDSLNAIGYQLDNDSSAQETPAYKKLVHEIFILLVEKGFPAERLLREERAGNLAHIHDVGGTLIEAIGQANHRIGEAEAQRRLDGTFLLPEKPNASSHRRRRRP